MALQLQTTTAQGFNASAAYARIITFNGNKETIQVHVQVHKDNQSRIDNLQPIADYSISLALPYGATMQQMYDELKLDTNFVGAIDC